MFRSAMRASVAAGKAYGSRIPAPPMVYIKGEEMTRYTMQLILDNWIEPHLDTRHWKFFDMSCKV